MPAINQIYTPAFRGEFASSLYRVIFFPEGYTSAEESLFYQNMKELIDRMANLFPLSTLEPSGNSGKISCYYSFEASANHGYATSSAGISGRTLFETYYENGVLHVNETNINQFVDDLTYPLDTTNNININTAVTKGTNNGFSGIELLDSRTLLVMLLPNANQSNIELEVSNENTYYTIITSCDSLSEQVVLRALCKMLQLGDEFDMDGTDFLSPTEEQGENVDFMFPNLMYYPGLAAGLNPATDEFKWRGFFNSNTNSAISLHSNMNPSTPNRELPTNTVTYNKIELWEGGGKYRKDVYRAAEDCLLRRKIGDSSLPLKERKVSFCPVCKEILSSFFDLQ